MIRIENLSKAYGSKQVLHNINLSFEKGKVYGIVGENGAGKTTLFKCISGLTDYTGSISSDLGSLKHQLGLLLAEPFFFSKITGKEYIQLLLNAREVAVPNIEEKNIFELPLNEYASRYSTGMKKKLALTAVLLQQNEIFVLDEPFNGVDIQSNLIIIELLKKLKSLNKTLLVSSHIFGTLAAICDEIFVLRQGQIVRNVAQDEFAALETEMKDFTVGNRIEKLDLT